jgi:hypothetical protein
MQVLDFYSGFMPTTFEFLPDTYYSEFHLFNQYVQATIDMMISGATAQTGP